VATNNLEYALINRIIQDQDFHNVEKLQITEDYFSIPEVKEAFRYIKDTYHNHISPGLVPSRDMLNRHFPTFFIVPASDPVPILCTELRQQKLKYDLMNLGGGVYQEAQHDPISALASLKAQLSRISTIADVSQDLSISAAYNLLVDRYNTVSASQGVVGIPYPWDMLNQATQGMQSGQYIVFYGRPKSMKSWMAIKIACHAYLKARRRVMYYTREMEPIEIAERIACTIAKIDYGACRAGTLQEAVKKQFFDTMRDLLEDEQNHGARNGGDVPGLTIVSDRGNGADGGGVGWLQAKIREKRPHLVIVDGMYLMKDDRSGKREVDWKVMTNISRDLKLTAQQFQVPLVAVTQATRKSENTNGDDLTELAFADAIGQDADAVFRVMKPKTLNEQGRQELIITAPGIRASKFDGMVVYGEPATNFDEIRPLTTSGEQGGYAETGAARPPSYGTGQGQRRPPRRSGPPDPITGR